MLGFVYTQLNMALAVCACALKGYPGKGFLGLPGYSCHCRGDCNAQQRIHLFYTLCTQITNNKSTIIIELTAQFIHNEPFSFSRFRAEQPPHVRVRHINPQIFLQLIIVTLLRSRRSESFVSVSGHATTCRIYCNKYLIKNFQNNPIQIKLRHA